MAARVPCEVRISGGPRTPILTESRHLLGPVEGTWWMTYSWWVIPVGLLIIFLPWFFLFRGETTPPVQPAGAPPAVTQQQVPAPSAPVTSSGELSAEELNRRYVEHIHRRGQ